MDEISSIYLLYISNYINFTIFVVQNCFLEKLYHVLSFISSYQGILDRIGIRMNLRCYLVTIISLKAFTEKAFLKYIQQFFILFQLDESKMKTKKKS